METITWTADMRLGLPRVDAAHESLVMELERLVHMADTGFSTAFQNLVERIERDFQEEEAMMEEMDYPGLCGHREQHARVLGALHHVAARVMDGDIAVGREALALLPQWFVMHLSTMDTALALACELCDSERSALPVPPAQ